MTKKKKITISLCAVLAVIAAVLIYLWVNYGYRTQSQESTSWAMGTYVQQVVYGKNAQAALTTGSQAVTDLEDKISWRVDDSDISRLNNAAGSTWEKIDPKTISILKVSLDVAQKSNGFFDPTILPITSLWNFGGSNQRVPSQDELQKFLPYVNYQDLRINEADSTASLKKHYEGIDLGSIGKGAACDDVVAAYQNAGIDAGIVAVGGSIGLYGKKPGNSNWSVAIRDPKTADGNAGSIGTISMEGGQFVSTSGTYEKEFTQDGKTYHHLLNPKSGMPEDNGLVSVSVVCDNGALSDALSTACFVLGLDDGMKLAESYQAGIVFVDQNGKVTVSSDLKGKFQLTNTSDYSMAN